MSDDTKKDQPGGGFDDWLDDEPGPVTDPYKVLASEQEEQSDAEDQTSDSEDETEEIQAVVVDDVDETSDIGSGMSDSEDETEEIETVEVDEVGNADETTEIAAIAEDHDDTGELEVTSTGDEEMSVKDDDASAEADDAAADDAAADDAAAEADGASDLNAWEPTPGSIDADELDPVASIGFGALWSDDGEPESSGTSVEVFDMSQDDYLHTATREHEDLAESIALADDEDTEQVALAAPIPGLDSTVVGFDDVVEAEGLGRVRARASGDLIARIVTAIVLVAALGASLLWRPALVVFALAVFVLGAGEFYTALVRSGRKPIALFGFIGIIGASLGAFFSGALWIPLAFLIAVTLLLLFYAVVPGKIDPMANLALTITVMVWAGLGSFAMLIAKSDSYRTLVFGVVAAVAAMDIAQYFFGRALGRHQLAPWVSPKKTIEGLVAGVIVALTVGALLHFLRPFELTSGLAIGAAVAVFAPLGDLAMSAAKRSLGLKDMGSVLPGHGGFMDRIDGLLFVIPVAWAIFVWAGIL